ncbi:efflux RND transporter periplasmic adaptor subunit [Enterococcus sp. LJL99]
MKKHYVKKTIILTTFLFCIYATTGCKDNKKVAQTKYDDITISATEPLSFSGVACSQRKQAITFNSQFGETIRLEKNNKDEVLKGDLVAAYYSLEVNNSLLEQEVKWQKNQNETKEMEKDTASNKEKLEKLNEEKKDIENQVKTLKTYAVAKIYADFDGTVVHDATATAENGQPIAEIFSKDQLIEMKATEYDVNKLHIGQVLQVKNVSSAKKMSGEIIEIASFPEDTTSKVSSYKIKIKCNEFIKNGNHLQLFLEMSEFKIPLSSVMEDEGKLYVYKIDGKKAKKSEINGEKSDNYFIVTSGLEEKDRIIKNVSKLSEKEVKLTDD